ncbi:MAG TPA: tryptophan synthase subunit alpha [Polyangiaceae bacterium]|nr:tryptophan synthase subunit alpha [Polyangiaceae bacterium]
MFARLGSDGAFIPFVVLGDPNPDASLDVVEALVRGGADALELGIPFSDPVADGPTIQAADLRALAAGTRPSHALSITRAIRERHPSLPMGLLVYANLVEAPGRDRFYARAAEAGIDSVLVADVPTVESAPYAAAAHAVGIEPVLIATPNATDEALRVIAETSQGYTYVVSRVGVTGAEDEAGLDHTTLLAKLDALGAPPCVLGFGISSPAHVRAAIAAGARGAISGSAVVRRVADHLDDPDRRHAALETFVAEMKAATRSGT